MHITSISSKQLPEVDAISSRKIESHTQLLSRWQNGDQRALNQLIQISYQQLTLLSRRLMRNEACYHTLQTEALLHEAYFRLRDLKKIQWRDRKHFFSVWSGIMRRVLIDSARQSRAKKRGGSERPISLDENIQIQQTENDYSQIYTAIDQLKAQDELKANIVELRYFVGLSTSEIAMMLDISPATVKRKWTVAKAWLYQKLGETRC
ncbi:MAG TPA: sigma-70 family RNA polymerase sigma factor [Gammaproteobacteria bacterium]|nr:sigma-70 family RNA polymerase sigma factor [Gammaproteobacteria bacterium]